MAGIAGEFAARGQSCRRLLTRPAPDSTATLSSRDWMSGEAMSRLAGSAEEAIISCCSEHALRSAAGPDSYAREPAPAVLTAMLDEILAPLGDPDRAVLTWISYRVPAHDIANWLGISAPTTKVRIHRLRNRLKRAAALYARRLDEKERAELAKYVPELGQSEEGE